jgi:DNA segregation ATPase FtsK/SpoIIIE, S-DNA-T family
MTEPFSPDGPRQLLADLCRLVRERASTEAEINARLIAEKEAAAQRLDESQKSLAHRNQSQKKATEEEYAAAREKILADFEAENRKVQEEFDAIRAREAAHFESDKEAAQQQLLDARWEVMAMTEAARGGSNLQVKDILEGLETRWKELQEIHQQAVDLLQRRGQWYDFADPPTEGLLLESHPAQRFCHALELARLQYRALTRQVIPQFFTGIWPLVMYLVLWGAAIYPSERAFGWDNALWAIASAVGAFVVFVIFRALFYRITRRQATEGYLALRRTLLEAGVDKPAVLEAAKTQCQRLYGAIASRHHSEISKADERFGAAMAKIQRRKEEVLQEAEVTYPARLAHIADACESDLDEINEKYPRLLREIDERFAAESQQLGAEHARLIRELEDRCRKQWTEMADRWFTGLERFRAASEQIGRDCREMFPDWNTPDWSRWTTPLEIPRVMPLGIGQVRLDHLEGGMPVDHRLQPANTEFTLPALLPFPQHSLLLLKGTGTGLTKAVDAMQAVMLRLLTSMPPGKVRFTIIDPVGLGENFSAFMHLVDFDEQLVANRIWTDTSHIEQRLADVTKHMENVIQVYLRKEFRSIREYNEFAGEMAEPYRVLVVANFPANFSEVAAQRIKSIVSSGARCGVFVLLSVDMKAQQPHHFQLPDLEPDALVLRSDPTEFVWEHPDYGPLPLEVESPPSVERFREILQAIGGKAKYTGRVEVPFSCIVPADKDWWATNSRNGINVPLGRAGAMKLQNLDLGNGTSQHVLISGKTGSGKSTLLHVLVTNLALRYSPDEVELYLVDFKKGVEFKAYARYALPHARVIAIESEREFGLSVLQRLDSELRDRGDTFRKLGVQDLKTYRAAQTDAKLPRILLIIDEFQELFVEDDRIAQESGLLLDRLVRQGRAFGIHVLLGSQTLGGAYSLARSTIGQMAVRIALQCSESDAHLILSEENTAARLLTRPGEAIYNDANGLYEGNHPFQIVWLPDNERDNYLERIGQLAAQRKIEKSPPIVFEGNVLADPSENSSLQELLASPAWPEPSTMSQAWLGLAVAIKDPTAAVFLRQNGSNLLLVGHREEAALGVMASCLISLAAQHSPAEGCPHFRGHDACTAGENGTVPLDTRFYILDGMRADAPEVGLWNRLGSALPHKVKIANPRGAAEVIAEVAAELDLRQQQGHEGGAPIFLLLYNLARFRDLRKDEDFSFSSRDEGKPPSPARQFLNILREGPALGIHALVWCDTYGNVTRFLDRQNLRDFEMRVLFQMNATDSSNLMDTPDASRLGVHRAILYDEGQGRLEKFRPYGLPGNEWLAKVKQQLLSHNSDEKMKE